jgi:methyl coenzyme M reductase alpha subunit
LPEKGAKMEGLDDLLEKDDLLYRVFEYDLYRLDSDGKSNRLVISVSEGLNGERKGKFYAKPTLMVRHSKPDYVGSGNSAEQALRDCLTKIKGLSLDEILEAI